MNKVYRIITLIMVMGFGFFFTTKLWNEDDRPFKNSYASSDMFNTQGRIRVEKAVYIKPNHTLDLVYEAVYFAGIDSDLRLKINIHYRDGSHDEGEWEVLKEAHHGNQTRRLARLTLSPDNLDWYYVELALQDPYTEEMRTLTIDWRKVDQSERITSIYDYDLNYEYELPGIFETEALPIEEEEWMEVEHQEEEDTHPEIEDPNWDLEILKQRLDLSKEDYERVKERLEESPDDDILKQSLDYYEDEIKNLEQQIEAIKEEETEDEES